MEVWRIADQFEVDRVLQAAAAQIGQQDFTLGTAVFSLLLISISNLLQLLLNGNTAPPANDFSELSMEILNIPEVQTREELTPILEKGQFTSYSLGNTTYLIFLRGQSINQLPLFALGVGIDPLSSVRRPYPQSRPTSFRHRPETDVASSARPYPAPHD